MAFPLRPLPVLEEFVGRNGHRNLPRLRLNKMRQRIDAGVDDRRHDGDHGEKAYQARHCVSCCGPECRCSLRPTFTCACTHLLQTHLIANDRVAFRIEAALANTPPFDGPPAVFLIGIWLRLVAKRRSGYDEASGIMFARGAARLSAATGWLCQRYRYRRQSRVAMILFELNVND
jgi:hypothetical protein